MPNILITTFGATWQILPELLGFTNPGQVDEAWLITTKGSPTDKAIEKLFEWHNRLAENIRPALRVWQVADTEDLSSEAECRRMAECIFRLVLHASERVRDGQLIISLTGGRKTMSSDIQNAAVSFGCHALVHVIQNEKYAQALKWYGPDDFTLTPGRLSIWEILLLIRNGFKSAFCSRSLRQEMLREGESEIIALIQEGLPS